MSRHFSCHIPCRAKRERFCSLAALMSPRFAEEIMSIMHVWGRVFHLLVKTRLRDVCRGRLQTVIQPPFGPKKSHHPGGGKSAFAKAKIIAESDTSESGESSQPTRKLSAPHPLLLSIASSVTELMTHIGLCSSAHKNITFARRSA